MPQPSASTRNPTKAAQARVGTMLNKKWQIDKLLGVGGMGTVFAATHLNNDSRAALKVLHAEYARVPDVAERFLREGRIANRVDHKARVPVLDDDVSDQGEPFLVMELLEGRTLGDLLRRSAGRMPLDKLFGVFDPVLELLAKCHEVDIVHRDIKPANIFLVQDGSVRVLDFGVARMREPSEDREATRAGIALGTASYIAPEQALGMERIDGRADLWSVGACLYNGLTGRRLHAATTEAEEFVLAATQAAESVGRAAPDLPPEVVAFVDKALAYDAVRRFQSAGEMRAELLRLLAALRAGTIQRGKQQKSTGVVVRGSEIIEDAEPETEQEKRRQAARLGGIFKNLSLAMASVRQYGFSHPQTRKSLQHAYAEIGEVLATDASLVRWEVQAGAFVCGDIPVWEPDRVPFDRIPHQLFADGIRKVQFQPGLTEQELQDFVAILLREVSGVFSSEDDSVTALWDRRFEHIAYLAVDSWAEGDGDLDPDAAARRGEEQDALMQQAIEFARIDKHLDGGTAEAKATELNIAASLKEVGEAAAAYAVDPMTKATLGAQIRIDPERFQSCFVDALVAAYLDARLQGDLPKLHQAIADWATDQVSLHAADQAFAMHQHISEAFAAQLEPAEADILSLEIAQLMFPLETLRVIMTDFAADHRGGGGAGAGRDIPEAMIDGLGRALDLLANESVYALVCECLDAARSDALRKVLHPYLERFAQGQEATLGAMLLRASEELSQTFVELLYGLGTKSAWTALDSAFQSPHASVRILALSKMGDAAGDRAREQLAELLATDDSEARQKVLGLIQEYQLVVAGPFLVRSIQEDDFHQRPVEERMQWLEAVASLNPARAEAVAIELLSKRRLLSSEASDKTRAIAAEFLARFNSAETLAALQTAAKQRWGTSAAIREASERAIADIAARQNRTEEARGT